MCQCHGFVLLLVSARYLCTMKNKRKTRFIVKAAHLTVEAIERNGLKCVLVGPIARYLHGSKTVLEVRIMSISLNSVVTLR